MKAIRTYALLAALLWGSSLASCKKSEQAKEKSSLLTTAAWKPGAMEWQTTQGNWITPPSWAGAEYLAPITFYDNGTYTTGTTSGSAGAWQLSTDKTQLVMVSSGGTSSTVTIASLTANSLQLSHALPADTYDYNVSTKVTTNFTNTRTTFSH
ncbi:hypothetical protein [Mucilaginibacter sp. dw_454]|uniref:hypothetical protein n=1 Tax=Mucilaginibacter sp. dw_454 TaxID=2720079 RepID=UPI001BD3C9BF|nr:hypothetical protein [Mucilaginibacter sp. dw_454]